MGLASSSITDGFDFQTEKHLIFVFNYEIWPPKEGPKCADTPFQTPPNRNLHMITFLNFIKIIRMEGSYKAHNLQKDLKVHKQ